LPLFDDAGVVLSMMSQGDLSSYTLAGALFSVWGQSKATFMQEPSLIFHGHQ